MVGGARRPTGLGWSGGSVTPCHRSTVTSAAESFRTPRPSSTGHRAPVPSSPCRRPSHAPAHRRSCTSTPLCSATPKRTRHPPKNERGAPWRVAPRRFRCRGWLELHDVLRRRALLGLHDLELHALALGQ